MKIVAEITEEMKNLIDTGNSIDWLDAEHIISTIANGTVLPEYEYHTEHTDCIWYDDDKSKCPCTCSQYRDGWNDAMEYIFKGGKGYNPYRRGV